MSIARTLKRDLGSQFRWSKNLNEGCWLKLQRAFWSMVYLLKGLKCAWNSLRKECLGSQVIYRGQKCYVSNWAGSEHPTLSGPNSFYERHCPREEITNVLNLRELYHRFEFGLSFYMGSWHGIDVNKRLYKWGDSNG